MLLLQDLDLGDDLTRLHDLGRPGLPQLLDLFCLLTLPPGLRVVKPAQGLCQLQMSMNVLRDPAAAAREIAGLGGLAA